MTSSAFLTYVPLNILDNFVLIRLSDLLRGFTMSNSSNLAFEIFYHFLLCIRLSTLYAMGTQTFTCKYKDTNAKTMFEEIPCSYLRGTDLKEKM